MFKKSIYSLLVAACISLTTPCIVFAADASQVVEMIELLPSYEKEMSEKDAEEIIRVMEEYESLPAAEKLKVTNYDKLNSLYNEADRNGYVKHGKTQEERDAERIEKEQREMSASSETDSNSLEYVFQITPANPRTSIVVHYVTDQNGDGRGDIPSRIVLTSPKGVTTPIANTNQALKDDTMDIALTWEDSFMQMDVAYASDGKWKITTGDPVTFTSMPYAGIKQPIESEEDKEKEDAGLPQEPKEEKKGPNIKLFFSIIALLAVVGYMVKISVIDKKKQKKKKDEKEEKEIEEPIPKKMTDEEVMEQLRQEHMERKQREEQEWRDEGQDEDDDEDEYALIDDEGNDITRHINYDEIDMQLEEYEEGDTGLLRKSDNPALSKEEPAENKNSVDDEPQESYNEMSILGDDFFGV